MSWVNSKSSSARSSAKKTPPFGSTGLPPTAKVDEDGLKIHNGDQNRAGETNGGGSVLGSGTTVINFGSFVPPNKVGAVQFNLAALANSLHTSDGGVVTFALEAGTGDLVGKYAGADAIRVHVSTVGAVNNGAVTYKFDVTLSQAIQHTESGVEDTKAWQVPFTVKASNNQVSAPINFAVAIVDDLPSITAATQGLPTLNVDESYIPGIGSFVATSGDAGSNTATANFSSFFTPIAGADGQKSLGYAFSFATGVTDGDATGLIDSLSGDKVVLKLNNGVLEGHVNTVGGDLVFTATVNSNTGQVTLTQLRAVHQGAGEQGDISEAIGLNNGLVQLSATVTDKDNDTASAFIDLGSRLQFHDDGPVAVTSGGIHESASRGCTFHQLWATRAIFLVAIWTRVRHSTSDEASGPVGSLASLFTPGADDRLTFSLSTNTGALPTLYSKGEKVDYFVTIADNNTPGNPSDDVSTLTAKAGGRTVLTLTVNADGSWNFDLDDQLDHVDGNGDTGFDLRTSADGSTSVSSIDFSSLIVATDADGDSATAAAGGFTIAIENDIPTNNTVTLGTQTVYEDGLNNGQSTEHWRRDDDGGCLRRRSLRRW